MLLKRLYTFSSLKNVPGGVQFSVKNRLSDAQLTAIRCISINGQDLDLSQTFLALPDGTRIPAQQVSPETPVNFPLRQIVDIVSPLSHLPAGKYNIEIRFQSEPFGNLHFDVEDSIQDYIPERVVIPRSPLDNYSEEIIHERQEFISRYTGKPLNYITNYCFDPHATQGNIENFTGVAQVPLGFAGPLSVHGEYAQGDFIIPLATTEGTLVASYNRGIKLLNASGGVKCTVVADRMQRAPVFVFSDARESRDFVYWVQDNYQKIKEEAEATDPFARLCEIDPYLASKFAYLRFNFTTGDAAGQNTVGRATFAACSWIVDNYPGIQRFYLDGQLSTDKKASQVNMMHTRGKRVTAEATIPRDVLIQHMRVEPESLTYHYQVGNIGAMLSGANNNGLHSANAITAMFIALGMDVANVAEASAGIIYLELTPKNDLYISLTIPSLIVASYGGGTGLATQRECLELMGCYGANKVKKLAEIVAGVALAGELSLGSAISSQDWVSAHEKYGRNG
jgi:hydroxymethylglutaryl-CoA reductase (NADPH)